MQIAESVQLARHTTLRLGGPAARFVAASTQSELVEAVRAADESTEPVLVLGGGSNLVVPDSGFPGVVVQVAAAGIELVADGAAVKVTAAAGQDWDELVQQCVADGLSGIECLSGIPGSAGATPIQNVSAYGEEVAQTITGVRAYDRRTGLIAELTAAECGFGYRTSAFKRQAAAAQAAGLGAAAATGRFVLLSVGFRLASSSLSAPVRYAELSRLLGVAEGTRVPLGDARAAVLELRRGKGMVLNDDDPDTRSAGSFFTNPVLTAAEFADLLARAERAGAGRAGPVPHWPEADGLVKVSAAWLIERAGFTKGFALSSGPDAPRISSKHTLALTNPGYGSTTALLQLARRVRDGVRDAFGVTLVNEPVLVGTEL